MILLLVGVATIVCLAFGLVAVATSPADLDKAVRQRLTTIHSGEARFDAAGMDASNLLKEEDTRKAGWLESALQRFPVAQTLQKYIAQGAGSTTVASLFLVSLGLAVAGALLTALFAPLLPLELAGACTLACLPALHVAWKRSRRIAAFAT